jgi:hypothetical protein
MARWYPLRMLQKCAGGEHNLLSSCIRETPAIKQQPHTGAQAALSLGRAAAEPSAHAPQRTVEAHEEAGFLGNGARRASLRYAGVGHAQEEQSYETAA